MSREEAEAALCQGLDHLAGDRPDAARAAFEQALALCPTLAAAAANLALLLEEEDPERADMLYRQALAGNPGAQALSNHACFLLARKRFAEAEKACHEAIRMAPMHAPAWTNLGILHASLGRDDEAEQCHRTALSLNPDLASAHLNLSYVLLRQGRWEEGWMHYERRDWYARPSSHFRFPRWTGEKLTDKRVLVIVDGGMGDLIQFCRYLPLLRERGCSKLSVLCHAPLQALFAAALPVDEAIILGAPLAVDGWDYWVPPLSLPALFGSRCDHLPDHLPYLASDPEKTSVWAMRLGEQSSAPRIGLVWKGNPGFENDSDRSFPDIEPLLPLLARKGIRFFSLQKGAGEKECLAYADQITDLAPGIADFSDTAAIIANLDLVISVDTSVAHLTAALGRPCWLLLPAFKPDWRWLRTGSTSPWYPQVLRLFRQRKAGAWAELIDELGQALDERFGTAGETAVLP